MTLEQRIIQLEKRIAALERVENIAFIKNVERRIATGVTVDTATVATTINESVRNSSDTGSETVAKNYDNKHAIRLSDGTVKYIGTYNS